MATGIHSNDHDKASDRDSDNANANANAPRHFEYRYPDDFGTNPLDRSHAESFDSADEIIEGSNEMKLMRRVVEKQRQRQEGLQHRQLQQHQHQHRQDFTQQTLGIERQDSMMSDTNSVNANDVFVSIEDSKEMEYLDVLDKHLNQTNPEALDYELLDDDFEGSHPNKQKFEANLDDIIEHLCVVPCVGCLPVVDDMDDIECPTGSYPRSVLRIPRYSSKDDYPPGVATKTSYEQPILIRSSSEYNATRNSVRFQNVDIRHLKMTLGNHPSATTGPPVMLDGVPAEPRHLARQIMTLEKYERTKPPRRKRRQLKLTLQQRHNILVKERGFTFEEVKSAWQEALKIRRQRKETLERGLAMMKWDEVWESTCRKFNRLVDGTL
mmetsp:Transcript_26825/g.57853  ORF Transcript_26825/g.57853 Transcript_26825/m.57853 type:complete len:381 (-) Transcript_26825:367-1509(-)